MPRGRKPGRPKSQNREVKCLELHAGQAAIYKNRNKYNVVRCGRRFGKTTLAERLAMDYSLQGLRVGWYSPTYKDLAESFERLRDHLGPVVEAASINQGVIRLHTNTKIEFWSLEDKDSSRGREYALALIDEACKVPHLEYSWNYVIRHTLLAHKGHAWFFSTPKGHDFFFTLHNWGESQDAKFAEWSTFHAPSWSNPILDRNEIESYRNSLPERAFRQEILAEFIDDAGGVFHGVESAIDHDRIIPEEPAFGGFYSIGLDVARSHDYTVISVVDSAGRQVYFERFNQISWERIYARAEAVAKRYPGVMWVDATGVGDPVYEELRRRNINAKPFHFSNSSKEGLIDSLAIRIERGTARLMNIQVQTAELKAYQYDLSPSGTIRMNAPQGMHDDCVIALALAYWNLAETRPTSCATSQTRQTEPVTPSAFRKAQKSQRDRFFQDSLVVDATGRSNVRSYAANRIILPPGFRK